MHSINTTRAVPIRWIVYFMVTLSLFLGAAAVGVPTPTAHAQTDTSFHEDWENVQREMATGDISDTTRGLVSKGADDLRNGRNTGDAAALAKYLDDSGFGGNELNSWEDILGGQDAVKDFFGDEGTISGLEDNKGSNAAQRLRGELGDMIAQWDSAGLTNALRGDQLMLTDHSTSDLIASVMFSQSGGKTLDEASVPLDTLRRYPTVDDGGQKYGELTPPGRNDDYTSVGSVTGNYIDGLYSYNYLAAKPNDDGVLGFIANLFLKKTSTADKAMMLGMRMAVIGAGLADLASSGIETLFKLVRSINIPYLLGFASAEDPSNNNKVTRFAQNVLGAMGLNDESAAAAQYFMLILVGGAFLTVLVLTLRRANRGDVARSRGVRNFGSRLAIIIITVPFALILTTTIDTMTTGMQGSLKEAQQEINDGYVLDTLDWATQTNLSFGPAGISGRPGDKTAYAPTKETVRTLNKTLREGRRDDEVISPVDQLDEFTSGRVVSIQQYFNRISNGSNAGALPAASIPNNGFVNINWNDDDAFGDSTATVNNPYFLHKRDRWSDDSESGDGGSSSSDSDKKDDDKDTDDADKKDEEENKDDEADKKDDEAEETTEEQADEASDLTGRIINLRNVNGTSKSFDLSKEDQMYATGVYWNKPESYIYGASPTGALSREQNEFGNFIFNADSKQNWNPETGEKNSDISDDETKALMNGNAATIALYNRYAGITNVSGMESLSTQSVAFLLQSSLSNDSLEYKGYQTAPSAAGSAKNRGVNGTQFFKQTIPSANKSDFGARVTAMSVQWLVMGLICIVALLAMLRSPILAAMMNMFRGFFSSLFTGNIAGLLSYTAYFVALRLSFLFAYAAIVLGANMAASFVELFGLDQKIGGMAGMAAPDTNVMGLGGLWGMALSSITDRLTALFSLVIAAVLCTPIISTTTSSGKVRRMSVISAIITLPYVLADSASEYIDRLAYTFGQKGTGAKRIFQGGMSGANPMSGLKEKAMQAGNIGIAAGTAAMTGGASAAATAAGSSALSKLGGGESGGIENRPEGSSPAELVGQANEDVPQADIAAPRGGGEGDPTGDVTATVEDGQSITAEGVEGPDETPQSGVVGSPSSGASPESSVSESLPERGGGEPSASGVTDHAGTAGPERGVAPESGVGRGTGAGAAAGAAGVAGTVNLTADRATVNSKDASVDSKDLRADTKGVTVRGGQAGAPSDKTGEVKNHAGSSAERSDRPTSEARSHAKSHVVMEASRGLAAALKGDSGKSFEDWAKRTSQNRRYEKGDGKTTKWMEDYMAGERKSGSSSGGKESGPGYSAKYGADRRGQMLDDKHAQRAHQDAQRQERRLEDLAREMRNLSDRLGRS